MDAAEAGARLEEIDAAIRRGRSGEALERIASLEAENVPPAVAVTCGVARARVLLRRGQHGPAEALLGTLVQRADAVGDPALVAEVLIWRAWLELERHRDEAAFVQLERALALAPPTAVVARARAGRLLAIVLERLGDSERADALRNEGERELRAHVGGGNLALHLQETASILLYRGEAEAAERLIDEALDLHEDDDNPLGVAICLSLRPWVARLRGDLAEAERASRRAIEALEQVERPSILADTLSNLGELLRQAGRLDEAAATYRRALDVGERGGMIFGIPRINLALTELARGRAAEAEAVLPRSGTGTSQVPRRLVGLVHLLGLSARAVAVDGLGFDEGVRLARFAMARAPILDPDVAVAARHAGEAAARAADDDDGGDGDAWRWLARAAWCHGLALEQLVRLGDEAGADEARRALRELGASGASPRLGGWLVQSRLGSGGMGTVWRAVDPSTGDEVAIKCLTAGDDESPFVAQALEREILTVARLGHPAIVSVIDVGTVSEAAATTSGGDLEPGGPWLAMELVEGGTLEAHCGRLPWSEVAAVLLALLDALAHAHAHGVLHLDLKPANVLLDRGDDGLRPKLADFGLALALSDAATGVRAGTPAYMAPEQFAGRWRDLGPATDLYALGCLATALVQGAPPFDSGSLPRLRQLHLQEPPPPLRPRVPVPDGFDAWLERLLAKDPVDRFACAADAAWALRNLPEPADAAAALAPAAVGAARTLILDDLLELPPEEPGRSERPSPSTFPRAPMPPSGRISRAVVTAPATVAPLRAPPLVGRESLQDRLWERLGRAASEGRVNVVELTGPSGVGCSALARWLAARASELGSATALVAEHDAGARGVAGLVDGLCRGQGLDGDELVAHLRRWLRRFPDRDIDPGALARLARQRADLRDGVALVDLIEALAEERPVVLLLEDVGEAGRTLHLLAPLLSRPVPVLVVLTSRSDLSRGQPDEGPLSVWRRRGEVLTVRPLGDEAMDVLLGKVLGLSPAVAGDLRARAGGSPDFALQLVAHLRRTDGLVHGPEGLVLREGEVAALPERATELWAERLEPLVRDLGPEASQALEIAAALGIEGSVEEWEAACALAAVTAPPQLGPRLLRAGLAEVTTSGGVSQWRLVHGSLREWLLSEAERRGRLEGWHAACAGALEGREGAGVRRGLHLSAAGRLDEALPLLASGAEAALARHDLDEADRLLAQWERTLLRLGAGEHDARWLRLAGRRSWAFQRRRRFDEAEEWALRGLEVARRHGDRSDEAAMLLQLGLARTRRGDPSAAETVREAYQAALEHGDVALQHRALFSLADTERRAGRYAAAAAALARAAEAVDPADPAAAARRDLALALSDRDRGRLEEGLPLAIQAARAFAEASVGTFASAAWDLAAWLARGLGDLQAAASYLERAEESLSPQPDLHALERALLAATMGHWDDAARRLREVAPALEAVGYVEGLQLARALRATIAAGSRSSDDAVVGPIAELVHTNGQTADGVRLAELAAERAAAAGHADRAARLAALAEEGRERLAAPFA